MTYYKLDLVRDSNGYYFCNDADSWQCEDSHECPFCIHGMHISDVRQMWKRHLVETCQDQMSVTILDSMNDEQFIQLLDWEYCRQSNPHHVFYFDSRYEEIARQLPDRYDTVIDFGCAAGLQSFLFGNVRYIGVDDFSSACVSPEYAEFYDISAQEFILRYAGEFNQYSTLAVCLNVPDSEARKAVDESFENSIIVYNGPL